MKLISEMSFDECLAELQGVLYTIKANGGSSTKGTEMRKTFLAEVMIKMDRRRFIEIFQDQFEDFSHLIIRKAVQESPIMLFESLRINSNLLSFALSLIPDVTPPRLQGKQVDVIIKYLQNGIVFSNISYWNDLFEILEKHRPEALDTLCINWLKELSNDNTYESKDKIGRAESFLNKYLLHLSDTSKSRLELFIKDCKDQLKVEEIAQHAAYEQRVINGIEESIKKISAFVQSVNEEFIEKQLKTDLKNKEELLSYDMEFTDDLYHSLNKNLIFIAHGDDEMQYVSSPFYVLNDIQKLLYSLDDFFNTNELELDLNELIKELKHAGEKRFASFLEGYEPADDDFESSWLNEITEVEQNEWEGGYAGTYYFYFIGVKEYSKTLIGLKQVCLILIAWADKTLNR